MEIPSRSPAERWVLAAAQFTGLVFCVAGALWLGRYVQPRAAIAGAPMAELARLTAGPTSQYRGVLTFATPGAGDPFGPAVIQDFDLASKELTIRFDGLDATRAGNGETAFIARLSPGWAADHGVVVADARAVPGALLYVCRNFHWTDNSNCSAPKLAPNARLVAFAIRGAGKLCKDNFGTGYGDLVVVSDRRGHELARFEGFTSPEWLPDGRLLMMGTQCRNAGVWITDAGLRSPARIDASQINTPARAPVVSPDGNRIAFVWNRQLWALELNGAHELSQITHLSKSVSAAAWSPDGSSLALLQFDVSMPLKSIVIVRPGADHAPETLPLPVYPYGPLSWH